MGDFIKRYKLIVIAVLFLLVVLIGVSGFFVVSRSNKEAVTVYLLPSDTKLTVNGEQINEGTNYLKPGSYSVEASRSGFASKKETVTIGKPNTTAIDIALDPVSESATKWRNDHQDLYLAYEGRAGVRANDEGEAFTAANPITSALPFENFIYTIGYRADPADNTGNSIIIEIDTMNGYRNAAIDKIRELGYDPTNFKIVFRDYESPFDHE
ncbi:MAG: exported protein of unknown function [Candidatus Saccharibacteria bacterium]|nr:exported protein of unknown function [Candidatus Saccharibacteria bacterium]